MKQVDPLSQQLPPLIIIDRWRAELCRMQTEIPESPAIWGRSSAQPPDGFFGGSWEPHPNYTEALIPKRKKNYPAPLFVLFIKRFINFIAKLILSVIFSERASCRRGFPALFFSNFCWFRNRSFFPPMSNGISRTNKYSLSLKQPTLFSALNWVFYHFDSPFQKILIKVDLFEMNNFSFL